MKRSRHRGGSYGFEGSLNEGDLNSAGAGNPNWVSNGGECGVARAGNNDLLELGPKVGGRRRRRSTLRGGSSCSGSTGGRRRRRNGNRRRTMKGGRSELSPSGYPNDSTLALQQPRAGYTFDGSGYGGMANAVSVPPYSTFV